MKVQDLIDILMTLDPKADVLLLTDPRPPVESELHGVAVRSDFADAEDLPEGAEGRDVLLLQGGEIGPGTYAAWEAART